MPSLPFSLSRRHTAPFQAKQPRSGFPPSIPHPSHPNMLPIIPSETPSRPRPSLKAMRFVSSPSLSCCWSATNPHTAFSALPSLSWSLSRSAPPSPSLSPPPSLSLPTPFVPERHSQSPTASAPAPAPEPESSTTQSRRTPPPSAIPSPHYHTSDSTHTVEIPFPCPGGKPFPPEMVTISLKKGNRIDIVADAWHLEKDCHYEWHVAFPSRTVDMSSLRARFNEDGTQLTINVRNIGCPERMYA
ncbi:hypothetical protein EW146_g10283 [Bondarzewia mesenterica]|uniref:SHSP domain-containing protein n=1 Tax=Bondarzewia mesenterica TaxID=1095465 RepID=A0A4S4KZ98_9AGAM|nr:hypothetical protein EW146_g10283 [Bondarzewia mesenterica]